MSPRYPVLQVDPRHPDTLYVPLEDWGVYKSIDGAKSWKKDFEIGSFLGKMWGIDGELFVVGGGGTVLHKF